MTSKPSNAPLEAADRFHSAAIHALRHIRRADPETGLSPARLSALSRRARHQPPLLAPPPAGLALRAIEDRVLLEVDPLERRAADVTRLVQLVVHAVDLCVLGAALA